MKMLNETITTGLTANNGADFSAEVTVGDLGVVSGAVVNAGPDITTVLQSLIGTVWVDLNRTVTGSGATQAFRAVPGSKVRAKVMGTFSEVGVTLIS